ncbi:MAG: AAA family ATPase [Nocardioides sp.]
MTASPAALHETHSGLVLLMGESALKFKKPVDLGFLDFTTLAARHEACSREVVLNSRLAPDVYLGVGDFVGPDGVVIDHVVLMRRMPEERRLSTLVVDRAAGVDEEIRSVARRLASFHASAGRVPSGAGEVTADSLRALWQSSFDAMPPYLGDLLDAGAEQDIERLVRRFLDGRGDLFRRRQDTGSVLDGHGDLLAEDIFCLPDGPRILDCLEFDDRLRTLDQIDDAAFLAMDLECLGAPDLAERFLDWYREFSGDTAPDSLAEHYLGYRAFVRAKVACVRHRQGAQRSRVHARRLVSLTLAHLERGAVRLVLVGGSPGSGKSTVAAGTADALGMTLLASDRIRKELAGLSPLEPVIEPMDGGIYGEGHTRHLYLELMRRAAVLLRLGESVIVDAAWSKDWQRELARDTARDCAADVIELRCDLPFGQANRRLRARQQTTVSPAGTVSDAGVEIAAMIREKFEPWRRAEPVDTSGRPEAAIENAVQVVRPADCRARSVPRSLLEPG